MRLLCIQWMQGFQNQKKVSVQTIKIMDKIKGENNKNLIIGVMIIAVIVISINIVAGFILTA